MLSSRRCRVTDGATGITSIIRITSAASIIRATSSTSISSASSIVGATVLLALLVLLVGPTSTTRITNANCFASSAGTTRIIQVPGNNNPILMLLVRNLTCTSTSRRRHGHPDKCKWYYQHY
jgi:hypothetical protein